jgi:hypothetical protein
VLAAREAFDVRLFNYFKQAAEDEMLPADQRRIRIEFKGCYYGDEALALYADWKALDYDVIGMFGVALIELPPKLRHDLIALKKLDFWHQWNARLGKKTPALAAKNPLREKRSKNDG